MPVTCPVSDKILTSHSPALELWFLQNPLGELNKHKNLNTSMTTHSSYGIKTLPWKVPVWFQRLSDEREEAADKGKVSGQNAQMHGTVFADIGIIATYIFFKPSSWK